MIGDNNVDNLGHTDSADDKFDDLENIVPTISISNVVRDEYWF